MPLSLNKLRKILYEKDFISKKMYKIHGNCNFIEIISILSGDMFMLYVPSKYKFRVDEECHKMKLIESGDYLFKQGRFQDAAKFYMFSEDRTKIEIAAVKCIEDEAYQLAYDLYVKTGNFQMLEFIKMNFMEKTI